MIEGDTDLPIADKLAADAGFEIAGTIDCQGKSQLDERLQGYNSAARHSPWFVLRDLDHDAACAGQLLVKKSFKPSDLMCFRLAVRELEAWLLADREAVCSFFRISPGSLPEDPDAEHDPTQTLVNLARRSRSRKIQRAMVPKPGMAISVGALYEATIIEFGRDHWNLDRAAARSKSLARARQRLRELAQRWRAFVGGGD